jgi:hypothetical protein
MFIEGSNHLDEQFYGCAEVNGRKGRGGELTNDFKVFFEFSVSFLLIAF